MMRASARRTGPIAAALGAAVLFGLSTPAAKYLVGRTDPWLLAGLLYLSSGVGLGGHLLLRRAWRGPAQGERLAGRDWIWLGAAILAGGCIAPILLMLGLRLSTASEAALLLNLEGVFTALLAWLAFREHVDRRIALGMGVIGVGALVLSWEGSGPALDGGAAAIVAACLAWGLDNNLTRQVSGGDPVQIAALKGALAGAVNVAIGMAQGGGLPGPAMVLGAAVVGLLGYGVSLVLFVVALRHLGSGRTAAYFSVAPFVAAVGGIAALGEPLTVRLGVAAALMGAGVWLHLTERHEHEHLHGDGREQIRHSHPHYPDIRHRHPH